MRYRPKISDRLEPLFVAITRTLAAFGLVAVILIVIVVLVAQASRAHAAESVSPTGCTDADTVIDFPDDHPAKPVTLRGELVQSQEVGATSSPRKYLAIALDNPLCASGGHGGTDSHGNSPTDFGDSRITLLRVTGIPAKWVGYAVIVTGIPAPDVSLSVTHLVDATSGTIIPLPPRHRTLMEKDR